MPTLLITPEVHHAFAAELRAAGGAKLRFVFADTERPLSARELAEVDIALMSLDVIGPSSRTVLSPLMQLYSEQLRAAPGLRWLHVPTAGVDRPIFQEMLRRGVRVTNSSGANAEAVAHSALMGVMLLARGGLHWVQAQRAHRWAPLRGAEAQADLAGQTAIVIGHGPIGRDIARLLEALGLRVHKLRHAPQAGDAERGIRSYAALPDLAREAHWLVIACPLTEATRHLVDAAVLRALPRGACVVNVGRGGVLDEQALLAALADGQIAGAHLDVFEQEPLPPDSPFWDLPNVLVSPHNAGSSQRYGERCVHLFLDNLARWTRGEPLLREAAGDQTLRAAP
ncbi:D-2-hydroxyacid dehydrogenase [Hylemonella gracilis]|uniref:D-2-hydroxyacid dehydrogenase n=1 Tax=Hylemonella gracilis TaxID=80880 RepID=A0A4P6ULF0_9BURK|nr:D-2-hydroxyacid dehydrogenase [Hylemonella gracilis]QBK04897.1 D-2-hydroxyacid dehydrogenase [Hylemonella gracilis]